MVKQASTLKLEPARNTEQEGSKQNTRDHPTRLQIDHVVRRPQPTLANRISCRKGPQTKTAAQGGCQKVPVEHCPRRQGAGHRAKSSGARQTGHRQKGPTRHRPSHRRWRQHGASKHQGRQRQGNTREGDSAGTDHALLERTAGRSHQGSADTHLQKGFAKRRKGQDIQKEWCYHPQTGHPDHEKKTDQFRRYGKLYVGR